MATIVEDNGTLFGFSGQQDKQGAVEGTKKKTVFQADVPPKEGYAPPEGWTPIKDLKRIALDIETHDPRIDGPGVHSGEGSIVGVGIAYDENTAIYYPTRDKSPRSIANRDGFFQKLRQEAAEFHGEIVGANLKYDLDWLAARHGVHFPHAKICDIQIAAPLLDENRFSVKLDVLSREYLGAGKYTDELKNLYGTKYIENMHMVDEGHAAKYCETDCLQSWKIWDKQYDELKNQDLLELESIESRLIKVLLKMRETGVRIDLKKAEETAELFEKREKELQSEMMKLTGGAAIQIWAAESIAQAFDRAGIEYPLTKKTQKPSITGPWLERRSEPLCKLIMQARNYDKTAGTFIKSYILGNNHNGRVHCNFNPLRGEGTGAISGRFSSSNPNLQNIPSRDDEMGPICRSMFIPEEGMLWGCADYSQIEYRFLAHYAGITPGVEGDKIIEAYVNDPDTDIHDLTASFSGLSRKENKHINFGVVYGMGIKLMAARLGKSYEEAKEILDQYHANAPFMRQMDDACKRAAGGRGFIRTIGGRYRRFNLWEYKGKEYQTREEAEEVARNDNDSRAKQPARSRVHTALNALLQGSAADLMKIAMVKIHEAGIFDMLPPHITVHDELDVSVPDTSEGREAFQSMQTIMTESLQLKVPIMVGASLTNDWSEAK